MSISVGKRVPPNRPTAGSGRHRMGDERERQPTHQRLITYSTAALAVAVISVVQPGIWFILVTLLMGVAFGHHAGWRGHELRVVALALATTVAAIDYLSWRFTVVSWQAWLIGIPLLLAEAHAALHAIGLQLTVWPRRANRLATVVDATRLPIYVFVPTVDEGVEIIGPTLRSVMLMRDRYVAAHPWARVDIIVCNDGGVAGYPRSDEVIALARGMGARSITRRQGGGAKAGNIEHARRLVGADGDALIVIFDADQTPNADFLTQTIPAFSDPRVGWVQTGQFYRNRSNPVARWADDQQSLFYRLLCPAKAARDAAFICGTNVVVRAAALDEIGGLPQDSVTEDFAASVLLAPRWRSVYLPGVHATGVGPMDFRTYLRQQERWARGTLTVLRRYWPALVRPGSGLSLGQRMQYGLAMTHYLAGLRDLVFFLAPLLFIFTGVSGVQGATATDFLEHFVPYYGLTVLAFWHVAARTTSWRSIAIGFASAPALLKATWMTVSGRFGQFTVTPKSRVSHSWWSAGRLYVVGLIACLGAVVVALAFRDGAAVLLATVWTGYLAVMFAAALTLVTLDHRHARAGATSTDPTEPVVLRTESSGRLRSDRPNFRIPRPAPRLIAVGAAAAVCAVVATIALPGPPSEAAAGPAPSFTPGSPRIGVSGADWIKTSELASSLELDDTIEGRTFEIADDLDVGWANTTAGRGGTPWITLSFGKNGTRTLESSLTSIASGVHDEALQRWADDLAAFGKPVYLTVLPQADRDFGVSSAVAHGGIPADAPRAWNHIRTQFAARGTHNVSWVWMPADPGRDGHVAPPGTSIDAVAVSWYEYPQTAWTDPGPALDAAAQNHPGRPLLLEISAAERPSPMSREGWLAAVAAEVNARNDIAAVVYHDRGPFADPTTTAAGSWRLPDAHRWARTFLTAGS